MFGPSELLLIFVIALVIFGPRKLPEIGKALGRGIAEFKKATSDLQNRLEEEVRAEAVPGPSATPGAAPVAPAEPVEAPHTPAASA